MAGLFEKHEHELQNHLKLQDPNTASLRFKLIQYSLNSHQCLRKLNKKSRKQRFIYTYFFLTKIVTAQT